MFKLLLLIALIIPIREQKVDAVYSIELNHYSLDGGFTWNHQLIFWELRQFVTYDGVIYVEIVRDFLMVNDKIESLYDENAHIVGFIHPWIFNEAATHNQFIIFDHRRNVIRTIYYKHFLETTQFYDSELDNRLKMYDFGVKYGIDTQRQQLRR